MRLATQITASVRAATSRRSPSLRRQRFAPSLSSVDGRMPVVVAVEAGLSNIHLKPGTRISSTWLYESVAADPARDHGKITLLPSALDGGGVTAATKT